MAYSKPYAPPPVRQTPKRRNVVLIVSTVVLLVFVMGAGCVALFLSGSKAVSGAKIPAEQFLTTLEKSDYAAARALLSTQTNWEACKNTLYNVTQISRRGDTVSHSGLQVYNVRNKGGVTQVELTYQETFADESQAPVRLVLRPEGGTWKVVSFNFSL